MKRVRSLAPWAALKHFNYPSPGSFVNTPVESGVHTIPLNTGLLDLLVEDRGSSVTLVVFHSALSPSIETLPVFQGQGLASSYGMNLVAVSDPILENRDIGIAWHLGNKETGPLKPIITPLLKHTVAQLGSSRNILFGASGGGFAAVTYGDVIPDSTVMVWNPRFDLGAAPLGAFSAFAFHAYGAGKRETQQRLLRRFMGEYGVMSQYRDGLPFDLLIFQNTGDHVFLESQVSPVLRLFKDDPRCFVRLQFTEEGHRGVPSWVRKTMLAPLASESALPDALRAAKFYPVSEGNNSQIVGDL